MSRLIVISVLYLTLFNVLNAVPISIAVSEPEELPRKIGNLNAGEVIERNLVHDVAVKFTTTETTEICDTSPEVSTLPPLVDAITFGKSVPGDFTIRRIYISVDFPETQKVIRLEEKQFHGVISEAYIFVANSDLGYLRLVGGGPGQSYMDVQVSPQCGKSTAYMVLLKGYVPTTPPTTEFVEETTSL